jgi:thioredoxin reductase
VAELNGKACPPGDYPVVVIGSGPGGLQVAYSLGLSGVRAAVLSGDDGPGGMFRRFPLFQRLITWTKLHAPAERGTRPYEWYDWNSLIGEDPKLKALVPEFMDGTSYFPARPEMERGLTEFTDRATIDVRYGCRWEATRKEGDGFVVTTSDGEYSCRALVIAVGMTEPWKPTNIPGIETAPHYVETKPAREYAGKRVLVIGKRNSGFEVADALLPWARQIILASPRPARISVLVHSTAAARARYLQPYEDAVLGGGNIVLDAATERLDRMPDGRWRAQLKGTTRPGDLALEVDEVIAATGFGTPLGDLPALGVKTFYQGRLPAQTAFWESASVPGVYFAGSITQGSIGLKKYGIPSNSAAVHGFRYNAVVMARHMAETRFGVAPERPECAPKNIVRYLLSEATHGPELWNQQSYLARVLSIGGDGTIVDDGILPLAHFVDSNGSDGIAMAVETDGEGDIHPAVYIRRGGRVEEHTLPSSPLLDYETVEHSSQLSSLLKGLIG